MFRLATRTAVPKVTVTTARYQSTSKMVHQAIDETARDAGAAKETSPQNPSVLSSAGAVGKQFNPDGSIGQIGEKIGGPFSSDGAIGSQFDASKEGIAGQVEKAVDGPAKK
ncbi:hypothetical protein EV122DRAFT_212891 [Schizophyllum commune]|nr:hypothetical protein K525DRAFT_283737 [Schizophyllum commune Loenen D]KAI5824296.1 hypothetical protein K523DRAFT_324654 [Schizophyllum commune Tattone D]